MTENSKQTYKLTLRTGLIFCTLLTILTYVFFGTYCYSFKNSKVAEPSINQIEDFFASPISKSAELKFLPYDVIFPELNINAKSCIIIDTSNACILYEKNADEIIPPASMTKLVVMYIVFQEVATGRISLNDVVPLPKESWAISQPSDSSLMFLGEDQTVTLDELLKGLAVCSGNDAAVAVAHYVTGSVPSFIERMNYEMSLLGLEKTHFVEPSGYSEENVTTAREFAKFANHYINTYPESLTEYHSLLYFEYPKEHNLPVYQQNQGRKPILQYNTNKALGKIDGVNGLKTGFIYESGYNLSLTAKRQNTQILSVTMMGPGKGSIQGNQYRMEDANTITDYAFDFFSSIPLNEYETAQIQVVGGKAKKINLIADIPETLTVPSVLESTKVTVTKQVPAFLEAPITSGQECGKLVYSVAGTVLQEIPLVAEATVEKSNYFEYVLDLGLVE